MDKGKMQMYASRNELDECFHATPKTHVCVIGKSLRCQSFNVLVLSDCRITNIVIDLQIIHMIKRKEGEHG